MTHPHQKVRIDVLFKALVDVYAFSLPEATCEIITNKENLLEIQIHDRLKQIVDPIYNEVVKNMCPNASVSFAKQSEDTWLISISYAGDENYIWDRILGLVINELRKKKRESIDTGIILVQKTLNEIMNKFNKSNKHCKALVMFKKGTYQVRIFGTDIHLTFEDAGAATLEKRIATMLPDLLALVENYPK
ncbi:MAG: hypothetical protein WCF93_03465 [Candidatus Moraniibacteriota bacterium]